MAQAGSCEENGLVGFLSKLLGKSLTSLAGAPVVGGPAFTGAAHGQALWDPNSPLGSDPLEKKGLTADPSASYGLFGFMGARYNNSGNYDPTGSPLTLTLTGRFPKAQYMSLQIYRGRPFQTSQEVGKTLSDYQIDAKNGKNPFQTGDQNDDGTFEVVITPDIAKKDKKNHIYYAPKDNPDDSAVITGFYRVYLPDGKKIENADLPVIKAFDSGGNPVEAKYAKLVDNWYLNLPPVEIATNNLAPQLKVLPWLNLDCVSTNPSGLGSSGDAQYIASLSKVAVGDYVVVKFRAPAVYFGPKKDLGNLAVRYWSICPVYFPTLAAMNSLACDPKQSAARDVTLVFGKDRPGVAGKVQKLKANFLPDTRANAQDALTFLLRNTLAPDNQKSQVFKGEFTPSGNVYSLAEFLALPEPL